MNVSKKRKVIQSEGRAMIAKVYHYLKEEYNFMRINNSDKCDLSPLSNVLKRTAEATGVSDKTVTRILREERELPSPDAAFVSPMSKRRKRESKFKLDDTTRETIRTTIQVYHMEHQEMPTLTKLKLILKHKIGYNGCLSTLHKLLIELGYEWKKTGKRKSMQEKQSNNRKNTKKN